MYYGVAVNSGPVDNCWGGGEGSNSIYLEFSEAFNRVNHSVLLDKLRRCGVKGNLLRWFESYLSNRSYRVRVGSSVSSAKLSPSGVPQGSILGPLLFSIIFNDSPSEGSSPLMPVAEGTEIWRSVRNTFDACALQPVISAYYKWPKIKLHRVQYQQVQSYAYQT
ncbi:hypothetical protein AHF37_11389 [Paragonimus kellicotti]|nr:hypothetical protein AHF37_11389 [Paragonimus kellicotti]